MKAIVQERFGWLESLQLKEITGPFRERVNFWTGFTIRPGRARCWYQHDGAAGFPRAGMPKVPRAQGQGARGGMSLDPESVGTGVTEFKWAMRCTARPGDRSRSLSAPMRTGSRQSRRTATFEEAAAGADHHHPRPAGSAGDKGGVRAARRHASVRRRGRVVCGADRRRCTSRGYRCLQHGQGRSRSVARCGRRHRYTKDDSNTLKLSRRTGEPGRTTNELAFALAPQITTALPISVTRDAQGKATLNLTCSPQVLTGQRASLVLGEREILAQPRTSKTSQLQFVNPAAAVGEQFVRLRVDGVESLLVNRSATPPVFDATQKVTIT